MPPDDDNVTMGQYLFAPSEEPNTPIEDRLSHALVRFIDFNDHVELASMVPAIQKIMARHQYTDVFDVGDVKLAYRGVSFNSEKLFKLAESTGAAPVTHKLGTYYAIKVPVTLHPTKSVLQSWTVLPDTAARFAIEELRQDTYPAVFVCDPKSNAFFGRPGELAKAIGLSSRRQHEAETISIGSVKCVGVVFAVPHEGLFGPEPTSISVVALSDLVKQTFG